MACSLSYFFSLNQAFHCRHKFFQYPIIRSHNPKDNGKSSNIVDANLSVLRERIQQVIKKEKLIHTTTTTTSYGWNYKHNNYDDHRKYKCDSMISESVETMGLACGAVGLVFIIGSLSICFVSLLVYLYKYYTTNYI